MRRHKPSHRLVSLFAPYLGPAEGTICSLEFVFGWEQHHTTLWQCSIGRVSCSMQQASGYSNDGCSVDLDIENGGSTGYAAFVTEIRSLASGASKP